MTTDETGEVQPFHDTAAVLIYVLLHLHILRRFPTRLDSLCSDDGRHAPDPDHAKNIPAAWPGLHLLLAH